MNRKKIVGVAAGLVGVLLLGLFIGSLVPPPAGQSSEWRQFRIEVVECSPETSILPPGLIEDSAPRPFDGTRTIMYLEEADGSITECLVSVADSA
ncbi:MAG: hypothetical protein LN413_06020 [Candidatus Thermoplasmatota archaeon]|nr:hypothetical protein [Candidatus Thermoplasmatota archaeon]